MKTFGPINSISLVEAKKLSLYYTCTMCEERGPITSLGQLKQIAWHHNVNYKLELVNKRRKRNASNN